jgi:hypothetical protein
VCHAIPQAARIIANRATPSAVLGEDVVNKGAAEPRGAFEDELTSERSAAESTGMKILRILEVFVAI